MINEHEKIVAIDPSKFHLSVSNTLKKLYLIEMDEVLEEIRHLKRI